MCFDKCCNGLPEVDAITRLCDLDLAVKGLSRPLHDPSLYGGNVELGIQQIANRHGRWNDLVQQLQSFGFEFTTENSCASDITAWPIKTGNIAGPYGIIPKGCDNRNGFCGCDSDGCGTTRGDDHV